MAQLTDDCFANNGALMGLDEALRLLADRTVAVADPEAVPLAQAHGRVLAQDLVATRPVPPRDNAAVDGYAVHFDDLNAGEETVLPVAGRAAAGHPLDGPAARGTAVRIFTGAVVPAGPDTIMMQEDCTETGERVRILPGIKRGANLRQAGEDVRPGDRLLSSGHILRPQDIGMAASQGLTALSVYRPLRAALFSTGDELADPATAASVSPADGHIFDSNRYTLAGLLAGLGCRVTDLGILPDDRARIGAALSEAAESHDLIVTSGGMSVGEEDHVRAAVEALGRLHFWKLAIKPGRPVALGQIGGVPFIGLPGNPVAVMVTFLRVARPLILRLAGAQAGPPRLYPVRAGFTHRKKQDRREWVRARLETDADGTLVARKFERQGAGILASMVASDGLVELPESLTYLEAGKTVDFLPFSELGVGGAGRAEDSA